MFRAREAEKEMEKDCERQREGEREREVNGRSRCMAPLLIRRRHARRELQGLDMITERKIEGESGCRIDKGSQRG